VAARGGLCLCAFQKEVGVAPDGCFIEPEQHTSTSEHQRLAPDLYPLIPAGQNNEMAASHTSNPTTLFPKKLLKGPNHSVFIGIFQHEQMILDLLLLADSTASRFLTIRLLMSGREQ